jgi:hypothetical protein
MSSSIWTRCGGSSRVRPLAAKPWRVLESQQRISTRQLVDSDAEHELLEALIEARKPPLPRTKEYAGLDFLLSSAFRYPPLKHGSRFGTRAERSIWYASDELRTALAETAYYRLLLFTGTTARLAPHRTDFSAVRVAVKTARGVDLTLKPFDAHASAISSKSRYGESQQLGATMRAAGVEAFRYRSARDPGSGSNVALFTPAAFASKKPLRPPETWHCTVTAAFDVSFIKQEVGTLRREEFALSVFLVAGELPRPAL